MTLQLPTLHPKRIIIHFCIAYVHYPCSNNVALLPKRKFSLGDKEENQSVLEKEWKNTSCNGRLTVWKLNIIYCPILCDLYEPGSWRPVSIFLKKEFQSSLMFSEN